MKTDELRKTYLDFFAAKAHKVFASDSLVPADDPSLLFTGAGMNQFKPYFLGLKKDVRRAASCQKCLRTADLDRVGKTAYHHSFFEMLGNFSFGDYFKDEAIAWGWEFVTKALGLPKDRLWVSVYEQDDEAFGIWEKKIGLPASRIVRMGAEDNFWPSNAPKDGPNGPCGPCSEIYVGRDPGKGVEIWNLVFTQFDRQSDGSLPPLPQKNIDTGMGLERTAAVMQGVDSNFEADNFVRLRGELKALLKKGAPDERAHENAVMDHIRAVTFAIADGALPSNEGRGYVIRKIIRLASDHLEKAGAVQNGTLSRLVPVIVSLYGKAYPEIADRQKTILGIVENEDRAYLEAQRRVETVRRQGNAGAAEYAFMLYDTYGITLDKIQDKLKSEGLAFDAEGFNRLLEEQKERSRKSSKIAGEIFSKGAHYGFIDGLPDTVFLGYDRTESEGKVLRAVRNDAAVDSLGPGDEGLLFFDRSPFYAESGGQVGDQGTASGPGFHASVLDTQWLEKCAAHRVRVEQGSVRAGNELKLAVDAPRRADIMKNHTATHLLHAALRKTLGDHVKQSGSLVAPDYLRFDFTHFSAVDRATLDRIEALVNDEVRKDTPLDKRELSKEQALAEGAVAFFGEKYGDKVRVVSVGGFSKELCGGTHLGSTGEIGSFKIVSESSIQAGVRRIEAVTGRAATRLLEETDREWGRIARAYGADPSEPASLKARLAERRKHTDELKAQLVDRAVTGLRSSVLEWVRAAAPVNGVRVLVKRVPAASAELFQLTYAYLNDPKQASIGPFALLLQCERGEKATFFVGASAELAKRGFNSGKIVKEISAVVEGSGGGRPEFAVGGGQNLAKVEEALNVGRAAIETMLSALPAAKGAQPA